MLCKISIIATLLAIIVKSDPDCNYVRDPSWIDSSGEYQQRDGPIPLSFCTTMARYENGTTKYYSEMFLCAPWGGSGGLYNFAFEAKDCNTTQAMPIISEIYSNSGYECGSDNDCSIFNVRSNVINGTCEESEKEYDEIIVIADYCYVERDRDDSGNVTWRSIMASCSGSTAEYEVYEGVIDCTGEPGNRSISATSGTCTMIPNDDGYEERYVEILNCGETSPQDASIFSSVIALSGCSYVSNATYEIESERDCWNDNTQQWETCSYSERDDIDNPTPLGPDTCTKRYDNYTKQYGSQLAFCSDVLQLGFYAIWTERNSTSRCDGVPDFVATITDYNEFSCNNVVGSCDNFLLRISDFEDTVGDVCGYGEEYNEIRIVTNKCWLNEEGVPILAKCGSDIGSAYNTAQYNAYETVDDCPGQPDFSLNLTDGECYDFNTDGAPPSVQSGTGNFSNFQVLECTGDDYKAPDEDMPDCMYVESPSWEDEKSDQGFRVPMGICRTDARNDGAESKIYLCSPWGVPVVLVYSGDECGDTDTSSFRYATEVNGYANCDSSSYCDEISSTQMEVLSNDAGAGCMENSTNFDENAFIRGCTNDGIGSTYVDCDEMDVEYSRYDQPGCKGDAIFTMEIDRDVSDCASFPDGEKRYVELEFCGSDTPSEPEGCSYIINPTWTQEDGQNRTRDGAMPLSSDICIIELNGDELVSYMYFCDERSGEAFIAWWNQTAGCQANGSPTEVARITSAVNDYQCTGDNGANCAFGFVTTGNLDSDDECELPADIEQSARLIDTCWSSVDDNGDTQSWMVECGGDDLRVRLFDGDDCNDNNILNTVEVSSNECVQDFSPDDTDSQTYFVVNLCTEDELPTSETTADPTTADPTTDPTTDPTSNPVADPTRDPTVEPTQNPVGFTEGASIINIFISMLFTACMVVLN